MLFLTGISMEHSMIKILDTVDGTNEAVRLTDIAERVEKGELEIVGFLTNDKNLPDDAIEVPYFSGMYISKSIAKEAYIKYRQEAN